MGHHTRGQDDPDANAPHLDEHIDPALMTPEARMAELGAILAAGIGRLILSGSSMEKVEESSSTCLELPPEPRLDGRRAVSTRENNGERR